MHGLCPKTSQWQHITLSKCPSSCGSAIHRALPRSYQLNILRLFQILLDMPMNVN